MFETLTITLREGIEAALVIGIILAYISKTNKLVLKKYVYFGIISAIVGSFATAIIIQILKSEWSDFMDGLMFFVAAFFLLTMLVWMHRTSKHIRKEIEQGIEKAINKWNALGVLILTFIMIYREGAELVLFLSATTKSSPFVALEGAIGLVLATLFGYMFIKGSKKINLGRFFKITGIMIAIIIFKLFVGGIHEWSEVGVMTLSPVYMNIIGPLVKDSASIFFTGIMLGFLLLLFIMIPWNQEISTNNLVGIEKRKALGTARKERTRKIVTGIIGGLLISTFVVSQISALPTGIDPAPEKLRIAGNVINIPESIDGNLHKYVCDMQNMMPNCPMHGADGKANVRILAIQKTDGTTAVAYDACNLCGAVGFVQDGDQLICKRCGAPIDRDSVGQDGGCNPIPVRYMVNNSQIIIKADDAGGKSDLFK